MPKIACRKCGRQIYSVAPVDSLVADERRCSRCGASMEMERRVLERRLLERRVNPPDRPGPPGETGERRLGQRRQGARRTRTPFGKASQA